MDQKELDRKLTRAVAKDEKITLLDEFAEELVEKGQFAAAAKIFSRAYRLAS